MALISSVSLTSEQQKELLIGDVYSNLVQMQIILLYFDISILMRFLKMEFWNTRKYWFLNVRIQILKKTHSYRDTKFTYNLLIFYIFKYSHPQIRFSKNRIHIRRTEFTYNLLIFYIMYLKINFEIFPFTKTDVWINAFPKSEFEKLSFISA